MQIEQIETEAVYDAGTSAPIEKSPRRMPAAFDWKKQASKIPMSDWLIFGGAAACLLTLAISAGKPAPQITKQVAPQFDPSLMDEFAQADSQKFFPNFQAFLLEQDEILLAQRSLEYKSASKNFKKDKNNDSCHGFKTDRECQASFLYNRAAELENVINSPNEYSLVRINKTEAQMLNNFRVKANLSAIFSSEIADISPSSNTMLLQTRVAAGLIQAQEGASAEGLARQQLIQEEPF